MHDRTTTNKKEFVSTNPGVETLTFDVGHAKYAAKYQQSMGYELFMETESDDEELYGS